MKFRLTRKALIAILAAAALGGAGVAVAATSSGGSSPRQRYLDDVAHRLGVSPDALGAAMRAAETDRIDEAVAAGRLSKAQGEQLKQRIKEGKGPWFRGRFGPGSHEGALAQTVQSYLGLSATTILKDRRAGKSLAQIANSTPGKSAKGLKEALEKTITARVATAVSQGRISKAQQARLLSNLSRRLDALINRTGMGPRGPFGLHHRRHWGPGSGGGPAPGTYPEGARTVGPRAGAQTY
jgi:hypothetical protein